MKIESQKPFFFVKCWHTCGTHVKLRLPECHLLLENILDHSVLTFKHHHIHPYWIVSVVQSPSASSNLWKERSFREPHTVTPTKPFRRAVSVCKRLYPPSSPLLSGLFDLWSSLRRRRAISLQHCWWPAAKQHGLLSLTYSKAMFIGFVYLISLQGLTYLLPEEDGGLCLMTKCARREWPGQCWAG